MAANYVAVKINADHFPATAQQYGVTALPTTVITTPQGQLLDTIVGRVETADYVARLNQIAAAAKQRGGAVYAQVPAAVPATPPPAAGGQPAVGNPVGVAVNRPADLSRPSPAAPSRADHPASGRRAGASQPRKRRPTTQRRRRPPCFRSTRRRRRPPCPGISALAAVAAASPVQQPASRRLAALPRETRLRNCPRSIRPWGSTVTAPWSSRRGSNGR